MVNNLCELLWVVDWTVSRSNSKASATLSSENVNCGYEEVGSGSCFAHAVVTVSVCPDLIYMVLSVFHPHHTVSSGTESCIFTQLCDTYRVLSKYTWLLSDPGQVSRPLCWFHFLSCEMAMKIIPTSEEWDGVCKVLSREAGTLKSDVSVTNLRYYYTYYHYYFYYYITPRKSPVETNVSHLFTHPHIHTHTHTFPSPHLDNYLHFCVRGQWVGLPFSCRPSTFIKD